MPLKTPFTQTVYRDRQTGKFVGKSTWKRSKAQDGTRYKRERIKHDIPGIEPPLPPPEELEEIWAVTFEYE